MPRRTPLMLLLILLALGAGQALAQSITIPNVSPHAVLTQTIGLTDVTVDYHRPFVNERPVWGALVPYGQVWRAGANQNTTITFGHDVEIEGQKLEAGTYGLHMIPTEGEWTVIFSNNSTSWGSFFYNQEEDALRVQVTPKKAPHLEALAYEFHDLGSDKATLTLHWAELQVPIEIAVDTHEIALAQFRNELRGIAAFNWLGFNQAAGYCALNDINHEEALGWADQSIQTEERFENLQTKSLLLTQLERGDEAQEVMARALEIAAPIQIHGYGRQLIALGQKEKALEIFLMNAERHPDVWFIDVGLARGYSALGQLAKAAEHMRKAAAKAPANQQAVYAGLAEQLEKGTAI